VAAEAPLRLWGALRFLGQDPPASLVGENVSALWNWALINWRAAKIPRQRSLYEEAF
jgi:glutamyl-Q tRNA(Asp) synthetase